MASAYAKRIARVAEEQYDKFHFFSENDPQLAAQIQKYWTGVGLHFPGVGPAWSAVFISWCAMTAGATKQEFPFSARHSEYINAFIKNATNNSGVFRALPLTEYSPQIGDLIHNNRNGNKFDYDYARTHTSYESHVAIVIETGQDSDGLYALTVGGNESDSVRRKIVRLTSSGRVKQRELSPYICVVQDLK